MTHLDSCPECCKQVAALSGDDFIARLRQAHGLSKTPAPPKSLVEVAQAPKPPANQVPIANLPPELANNPQYEVLRELGRGGMGVVYLAKNKLMDRLEVLKVVNKTLLDQPGAVERFLREIRSAAKLNHANVVTAYSAVQIGELAGLRHGIRRRPGPRQPGRNRKVRCRCRTLASTSSRRPMACSTPSRSRWSIATSSRKT